MNNLTRKETTLLKYLRSSYTTPYLYTVCFINLDYAQKMDNAGIAISGSNLHQHLVLPLLENNIFDIDTAMFIMLTTKLPVDAKRYQEINSKLQEKILQNNFDKDNYISNCVSLKSPILIENEGRISIMNHSPTCKHGFNFNRQDIVMKNSDFLDIYRNRKGVSKVIRVGNCLSNLEPYYALAKENILKSPTLSMEYGNILVRSLDSVLYQIEAVDRTENNIEIAKIYDLYSSILKLYEKTSKIDIKEETNLYIRRKSAEYCNIHHNWSIQRANANAMFQVLRSMAISDAIPLPPNSLDTWQIANIVCGNIHLNYTMLLPEFVDNNGNSFIINSVGDLTNIMGSLITNYLTNQQHNNPNGPNFP